VDGIYLMLGGDDTGNLCRVKQQTIVHSMGVCARAGIHFPEQSGLAFPRAQSSVYDLSTKCTACVYAIPPKELVHTGWEKTRCAKCRKRSGVG
jgi:hypothetical protein